MKVPPSRALPTALALLLLALPVAAQQAGTEGAAEVYGRIERAVEELKSRPPPDARARLLDELFRECTAFLDRHLAAATREQLDAAGTMWLQLAQRQGSPAAAIEHRIAQLRALPALPDQLAGAILTYEAQQRIRPGNVAPVWSATDVHTGETVTLDALRGKVVLMDFWATWCPPCRSLMERRLAPLHARYGSEPGFVLVGIGAPWNGETIEAERAFADEHPAYGWRKVFDAPGAALQAYGIDSIPFLCLVDGEGRILVAGSGWQVIPEVERQLEQRFPAAAPPPAQEPPGHQ